MIFRLKVGSSVIHDDYQVTFNYLMPYSEGIDFWAVDRGSAASTDGGPSDGA